jgi:hypothetical protein
LEKGQFSADVDSLCVRHQRQLRTGSPMRPSDGPEGRKGGTEQQARSRASRLWSPGSPSGRGVPLPGFCDGSAAPVMAVGEFTKWASEKIGPWAWAGLAVLLIAGGFLYTRQPEDRRAKIRAGAVQVGKVVLDQIMETMTDAEVARSELRARVIAGPAARDQPLSGSWRCQNTRCLRSNWQSDWTNRCARLWPGFAATFVPTTMRWSTRSAAAASSSVPSTSSKCRSSRRRDGWTCAPSPAPRSQTPRASAAPVVRRHLRQSRTMNGT